MRYHRIQNYPLTYVNDDRYFLLPFLGGALIGGAAVGATRPRPIYNVAPYPGGPGRPGYAPGVPYGNYSYSYYYPRPY